MKHAHPTTVYFAPLRVKRVPEALTKPVTVDTGVDVGLVVLLVVLLVVGVGAEVTVPGRHWE